MTRITINNFLGERPRLTETLLPPNAAQTADNCNIVRGSLKAFRKKRSIYQLTNTSPLKTIYLYRESNGTERWLEWTDDVDVVPGPIAGDTANRVYFTGTDVPRVFDQTQVNSGGGSAYPKSSYRLGLVAPTVAPTAVLGGGGTGSARDVRHVYTYVRKWASGAVDESAPSPAGSIVNALQGQTINLSNITGPVASETGITHIWIYRLNTGTTDADYQFVDEITVGTTTYADIKTDAQLGDVIESEDWLDPPADMRGLIMLPNGCAAGFSGKQLCISVPYQVHAYPRAYRYTVPFDIVAIGFVGSMIVVTTTVRTFLFDATDPGFVGKNETPGRYPCLSKRGLVNTDDGVIYPSHDGLVIVGPGGQDRLLTGPLASREEWEQYYPSTIIATSYRNRYFAAFENTGDEDETPNDGFMLSHSEPESGLIGTFGGIQCLHADPETGKLYFSQLDDTDDRNYVYEWDSMVERLGYLWRSKKFVLPKDINFGAFRIIAKWDDALTQEEVDAYNDARDAIIASNQASLASDDIGSINGADINEEEINGDALEEVPPELTDVVGCTFKLYADDELKYTGTVDDDEPVRLPDGYTGKTAEIEIQGQIEVQEIRIATSVQELFDA